MSDDKPTVPNPEHDDAAQTQRLGVPDAEPTQRLPLSDGTRPLPTARPDDPLSIFDRPDEPTGPESAAAPQAAAVPVAVPVATVSEPASTGPRSSTIVWGFLVIAFGVGLMAIAAGAHLDVELAAIVLLAAAGVLLVIGSAVSAGRRRRRAAATPTPRA